MLHDQPEDSSACDGKDMERICHSRACEDDGFAAMAGGVPEPKASG